MEEKKVLKISLSTFLLIIAIIVIIIMAFYIFMDKRNDNKVFSKLDSNTVNNIQNTLANSKEQNNNTNSTDNINTTNSAQPTNPTTNTNSSTTINTTAKTEKNIILYNGIEISPKTGVQNLSDMKISDDSNKKYNTTYYNYENGKFEGTSNGTFGEQTYEGVSVVSNVKKISMTQKYNAIPRTYTVINELPQQLMDMADYSSVNIHSIDLDNNGKQEYVVCYTVNYEKGVIGNGEPQASSGIMLFDSNYKKIADLVSLENGFWGNIKEEDKKIFLSLNDVDYIDIDNDGIMELIIKVPTYDSTKISILKYNNGKIDGELNLKASVLP